MQSMMQNTKQTTRLWDFDIGMRFCQTQIIGALNIAYTVVQHCLLRRDQYSKGEASPSTPKGLGVSFTHTKRVVQKERKVGTKSCQEVL